MPPVVADVEIGPQVQLAGGGFGVDRFMRGQVGLGIFKFLIGSWATLGIWPLVDFIVALVKLGKYQDDFVLDNAGKWVEPAAH